MDFVLCAGESRFRLTFVSDLHQASCIRLLALTVILAGWQVRKPAVSSTNTLTRVFSLLLRAGMTVVMPC